MIPIDGSKKDRVLDRKTLWRLAPTSFTWKLALQRLAVEFSESGPRLESRLLHQSALEALTNLSRTESPPRSGRNKSDGKTGGGTWRDGGRRVGRVAERGGRSEGWRLGIQLAVGPQQLRLRNHNFRLTHRTMVKRLATSSHDPLGITDSACKNQSVMVSVQYGPFNTYIPIRSTTIGKSRVARDPITMHTSRRSNSDIACVTRRAVNPRQRSIDSYMHRDLTQSRHLMTPTESEGSAIRFDYNSFCCNPIQQPSAARTPSHDAHQLAGCVSNSTSFMSI
ncbi:hypothetical protein F511_39921 [Dorcoceras hygrometricum]|uniref:Uncharacterized protein n=1 Tax=Dorcoceras hygrometricum TaxID=472368 RepID=A0A2Z7B6Z7_9LAMI|nr:hypothetical protein F511_39921 [Dorcoceras hygrometricum]